MRWGRKDDGLEKYSCLGLKFGCMVAGCMVVELAFGIGNLELLTWESFIDAMALALAYSIALCHEIMIKIKSIHHLSSGSTCVL